MTLRDHNKIIAAIFFGFGVLDLIGWIAFGGFSSGTWLLLIFAIFYMFAGWKIHKEADDAKTFGIIASILCIMSFPIGTAVGIYGLWQFILKK